MTTSDPTTLTILVAFLAGSVGYAAIEVLRGIFAGYRKRKQVLRSLLAELENAQEINTDNHTATESTHVVPIEYPIAPFEIALLSDNGISVQDKTIKAVTVYLVKAQQLNATIRVLQDAQLIHVKREMVEGNWRNVDDIPQNKAVIQQFVRDQADTEMRTRITKLKGAIENERGFVRKIWSSIQ